MSDAILRLAVTSAKWDAHARGDSEAATAAEQELMRTEPTGSSVGWQAGRWQRCWTPKVPDTGMHLRIAGETTDPPLQAARAFNPRSTPATDTPTTSSLPSTDRNCMDPKTLGRALAIGAFLRMSPQDRELYFRYAQLCNNDRLARIIAYTPIPSSWTADEHRKWHRRRAKYDDGVPEDATMAE